MAGLETHLSGAHFHGNAKTLEHFICAHADDVEANDFFFRTKADEFHSSLGLIRRFDRHGPVPEVDERAERKVSDKYAKFSTLPRIRFYVVLSVFLYGLRFGQAYGANCRV